MSCAWTPSLRSSLELRPLLSSSVPSPPLGDSGSQWHDHLNHRTRTCPGKRLASSERVRNRRFCIRKCFEIIRYDLVWFDLKWLYLTWNGLIWSDLTWLDMIDIRIVEEKRCELASKKLSLNTSSLSYHPEFALYPLSASQSNLWKHGAWQSKHGGWQFQWTIDCWQLTL